MKVRISNNSLRFRLKQPEVEVLSRQRYLAEIVEFGTQQNEQLHFILRVSDDNNFSVDYEANKITISLAIQPAEQWFTTGLVGIDERIDTSKGKSISILVEKDFACLDGREEENEGTYPNPKSNS